MPGKPAADRWFLQPLGSGRFKVLEVTLLQLVSECTFKTGVKSYEKGGIR